MASTENSYGGGMIYPVGMKTILQQIEEKTGKVPPHPTVITPQNLDKYNGGQQNILVDELTQYKAVAEM